LPISTGVVEAFDYMIGIAVFGFIWMILDDPMNLFNSSIGPLIDNNNWVMYFWAGTLIIYLVFGAFRFLSRIREEDGGFH
jgi:hypothetical protein